jgi:23S rRNA (adenine2503-C2)-methyltransferase
MSFYNYCRKELTEVLKGAGFEGYRADQLFKYVYQKSIQERYIPGDVLKYMSDKLSTEVVSKIAKESISPADNTRKLLIELGSPKYKVESKTIFFIFRFNDTFSFIAVLICEKERNTICLSSQVGCSLSCTFCHTGTQKLLKNLSTSEIISQFILTNQSARIDNVVFMGQGEPLYNWRNVSRAVRILTDPTGLGVSKSKVTISTSGISPLIPKIASEVGVQLAISLHATNDATRSKIMPINDTFNIKSVLDACEEFIKNSKCYNRRISFEYVLLRGINDSICRDAKELVGLLKSFPAHVNLM